GKGGRLTAVASRPGFPRALARTFEDLRMAGIRRLNPSSCPASVAPLIPFLETIEEQLAENRLADRAETFNIALHTLRKNPSWPKGLPLLLLDLPLSGGLEQSLVAALVLSASTTMATALEGDRKAIEAQTALLGVTPVRLGPDESSRSL